MSVGATPFANAAQQGAGGGGMVVVTNLSSNQINPGGLCTAGFAFNAAGSIDEIGPAATNLTPVHPGEWWSDEPDVGIGANYDIRCVSLNSGTWDFQAATVGTWIDLSANRTWRDLVTAMQSPAVESVSGNFAIRPNGGGADLATFIASASVEN